MGRGFQKNWRGTTGFSFSRGVWVIPFTQDLAGRAGKVVFMGPRDLLLIVRRVILSYFLLIVVRRVILSWHIVTLPCPCESQFAEGRSDNWYHGDVPGVCILNDPLFLRGLHYSRFDGASSFTTARRKGGCDREVVGIMP
jgi:hypothetical protein